jgi:hypothetical protein
MSIPVTRHNVADQGAVRVMKDRCATCIFRPGNSMMLRPGRVKSMVDEATANQSAIICHDTLSDEKQAVCRGFFDRWPTQPLQIAERLGMVVEHEREPTAQTNPRG